MDKPLSGIRVLDLTRVLAGPYCTLILSDLGAEIIKVENPAGGDDSRGYGPFINGRSLYFISINRGKKSVSLNLKTPKGKEILKELAKHCDVLVENFRPGTMERLGLGYETLKTINPRLIYAASSGFGHSGPYSEKPAYDILAQAMGGIMSITGWQGMAPTRVGMSLGDITASLFTAIGINAALFQREKTGLGQKIDIAMLDCQIAILENALVRFQAEGKNPQPIGNRHPTIAPFQAYQARDEYFVIAIGNDSLWKAFCQAIEHEELITHELFATNKARAENLETLNQILEPMFESKPAGEWLCLFETHQIPSAPINKIDQIMQDDQIRARNMLVEVEDGIAGKIKIAGNPIKMDSIPESPTREKIPEIGEHNHQVLSELLLMSVDEINHLRSEGVI
ncbi:MAG: CaiB/BaiF CoA-transferase family protein [Candidatus Cloacimonadaceae bacterium]|nr:CaiB/BaiF CoA-transferase family protein [Candidatus Cloacimonadaceae bacterium]MDP3113782.1 CaiB/BaiF CoA-transferase family protein [Candidatus Cloacimonadaceae bacterium]